MPDRAPNRNPCQTGRALPTLARAVRSAALRQGGEREGQGVVTAMIELFGRLAPVEFQADEIARVG